MCVCLVGDVVWWKRWGASPHLHDGEGCTMGCKPASTLSHREVAPRVEVCLLLCLSVRCLFQRVFFAP